MLKHWTKPLLIGILLILGVIFVTACKGGSNQDELPKPATTKAETTEEEKKSDVEALQDVNQIPDDGVITKEQFATVAGEDRDIKFAGKTDDGISYTWTYHAAQIQNPEDQNLKIDFDSENLNDIKKQANNANDALKLTMHGKGLICPPDLEIVLPQAWQSDTGLLLKEQDSALKKMSDVTIVSKADTKKKKKSDSLTKPAKGTTTLTMTVLSLEGESYIVGGITDVDKLAAINQHAQAVASANANGNSSDKDSNSNDSNSSDKDESSPDGDVPSDISDSGGDKGSGGGKKGSGSSGDVANDDSGDNSSDGGSGGESGGTCTISINCSTILNNMKNLTSGKEEFVPSNGWILKSTKVSFSPGESVHDVLQRVCKDKGIHMESQYTPAYDSAYVEGINQLYEFDCGELSGWMYNVNGWFPNYGCSKYTVSDGDTINWVYTCDLGKDVGDNSLY